MRAIDADAFGAELAEYDEASHIHRDLLDDMVSRHTVDGSDPTRTNAELSDEEVDRIVELAKEKVSEAHEAGVRRGVEAAFEHADPAGIEDDDERPRYIADGEGESRENSRDFLDRAKLTELLDKTGFEGSHQRSNLLRIVDRAMVDSDEQGVAFDAQGFRDSMPLRVNDSREEFDDRVSQFVTESRENAQLESDRREFEASLDPFSGEPTTVRGYHIGHERGWIDDGEIDPSLAKDHTDDETRANSDRGLAKPEFDHDDDRYGSTAALRREQRERQE